MREPIKDQARLEHILLAIDRIFSFVKDHNLEEIYSDSILYYAVVKNIEIIGEAALCCLKNSKTHILKLLGKLSSGCAISWF